MKSVNPLDRGDQLPTVVFSLRPVPLPFLPDQKVRPDDIRGARHSDNWGRKGGSPFVGMSRKVPFRSA